MILTSPGRPRPPQDGPRSPQDGPRSPQDLLLGGLGAVWGHKLIFDSILGPSWVPFWLPKSTPKRSKIDTENRFKKDAKKRPFRAHVATLREAKTIEKPNENQQKSKR